MCLMHQDAVRCPTADAHKGYKPRVTSEWNDFRHARHWREDGRAAEHWLSAGSRRDEAAIDGMFIGIDEPRDDVSPLLVALGPSFKTGQERDVADRFRS
jgi:hypothetical protein